jgi:hypothetical protein
MTDLLGMPIGTDGEDVVVFEVDSNDRSDGLQLASCGPGGRPRGYGSTSKRCSRSPCQVSLV